RTGAQGRIRTSVARKERQIYSLLPLTTRPPVQNSERSRVSLHPATITGLHVFMEEPIQRLREFKRTYFCAICHYTSENSLWSAFSVILHRYCPASHLRKRPAFRKIISGAGEGI